MAAAVVDNGLPLLSLAPDKDCAACCAGWLAGCSREVGTAVVGWLSVCNSRQVRVSCAQRCYVYGTSRLITCTCTCCRSVHGPGLNLGKSQYCCRLLRALW